MTAPRREPGRDIWVFGGGKLCASLLAAGLVDRIKWLPCPCCWAAVSRWWHPRLRVRAGLDALDGVPHGIVSLVYDVARAAG